MNCKNCGRDIELFETPIDDFYAHVEDGLQSCDPEKPMGNDRYAELENKGQ